MRHGPMCEHLRKFEAELISRGVEETYRGQAWSSNCREWVYFRCFIDLEAVRARMGFDLCVVEHVNTDAKSGLERGFVCSEHHDAIMGRFEESNDYPTIR